MFWRFGGYANLSSIDNILDKPDVTVEELLDESDLIQELKQQNSKLIEYLRDENVLERLLRYVVAPKPTVTPEDEGGDEQGEKSAAEGFFGRVKAKSRSRANSKTEATEDGENKEEKQRLKYAYVACEILSSEVWSISEAVLENRDNLRQFWQYLKQPPPLDPVQAGYFTKVNESLLDRKTEEMLEFFKSLDGIVPDMLQHVDCPMILDLLLKIISLEKSEGGQGIVDWLQTQGLIPILLSYLTPDNESATQTSAGDFLKAIITISANATTQDQSVIGPNELTRQLVSEECIKTLIDEMLRGGNPLTVGVGIVIEVIRKNNSDYDLDNQIGPIPKSSDPIYLGTLLRNFAKAVPKFMELVHNSSHKTFNADGSTTTRKRELKAAFGEKIEPLGFDRFKTCELMAELLHCSNMALLNERGSDAEVKRRDAERDRLKAEGKLEPAKESPSVNDFGTSVDKDGFYHARAPSPTNESPEMIKRLEVQNNAEEEEFEKVAASEANLDDDVKDDFDEKGDMIDPSAITSPRNPPTKETPAADTETAATPAKPEDAESPTAAGLTDKVGGLDLDNDTEMTTSPPPGSDSTETVKPDVSLLTRQLNQATESAPVTSPQDTISPHPDDKPAPLFSGKRSSAPAGEGSDRLKPPAQQGSDDTTDITTIEDNYSERSVVLNHLGQGPQYEVDTDGTPVVGDLLKMMFVEHRVVPTILDFFFRFPWNNFLHNVVYDIVQQVFNGPIDRGFNRQLAIDLFATESGRITERIIEGQKMSDISQSEHNMRLGYMGHLTLIAEEVVKFTERYMGDPSTQSPETMQSVLGKEVWEKITGTTWVEYVENTLAETRERDNAILGGVRPDLAGGGMRGGSVLGGQFSGGGGSLISGLSSNNGTVGLDSMELSGGNSGFGGSGFGGGGTLLSGFTNSSDEEDEEMEEGEQMQRESALSDQDQSSDAKPIAPPPLQIPPSRARRQFAARLAQRKKALESANSGENEVEAMGISIGNPNDDPNPDDTRDNFNAGGLASRAEGQGLGVKLGENAGGLVGNFSMRKGSAGETVGPERLSELFGGLESDSDEEEREMGREEGNKGRGFEI